MSTDHDTLAAMKYVPKKLLVIPAFVNYYIPRQPSLLGTMWHL
jgi:hypothetical protein